MGVEAIEICDIELNQIPEVARVHAAAFPGYMNTSLGGVYLRNFIKWFCTSHTSIAICAMDEDRVVGYAVGAPQGYSKNLTRDLIWVAGLSLLAHPWLLLNRRILERLLLRLKTITIPGQHKQNSEFEAPVYSLVGIGVLPEMRGKRAGEKLLKAFEEKAFQYQTKTLVLSVYRDNSAREFYTKFGWELFDPTPNSPSVMYYKVP
jgi:ribosomal protein S18 acetylase RimI-like enzyme